MTPSNSPSSPDSAPSADETIGSGSPRILVVEDDPSITLGLRVNLEAEGYTVEVAEDGDTGYQLASTEAFDLVILDLMLPGLNGFEILQRLRERQVRAAVIILSARDTEIDKVMGLELGAEDYVTKPFGLAELLARVKVVMRRERSVGRRPQSSTVTAGELVVDLDSRQVFRGESLVELTATEFDVLSCLVLAGGRALSRDEIQARVWGPSHHGTLRTIDNFLLQLRSKLEVDPALPRHLVTVRGVGYRFSP